MNVQQILHTGLILLVTLITVTLVSQISNAQVGTQTNYWEWAEYREERKATVLITTPGGNGSGTLITHNGNYYILTAAHVACKLERGMFGSTRINREILEDMTIFYNDEKNTNFTCQADYINPDYDVAIISIDNFPEEITPLKLASKSPDHKDLIECMGYGYAHLDGWKLRHWKTRASFGTHLRILASDDPLIPGDSGGTVINPQGEVVGVISRGHHYMEYRYFQFEQIAVVPGFPPTVKKVTHTIVVVWPALFESLLSIKESIEDYENEDPKLEKDGKLSLDNLLYHPLHLAI